jgi:uncharacterized protein YaiE (UPF0345 family)
MSTVPEQFDGVSVITRANVYFRGNVVSHAVVFPDGSRKTLGLIFPGKYHFNTKAPEEMAIVTGNCKVTLDGASGTEKYSPGDKFNVPGDSGFTIEVDHELCEYICSFLS